MELTLSQASRHLGRTRRQVEDLIRSGRLRARKCNDHWVIEARDLGEFVAQTKVPDHPHDLPRGITSMPAFHSARALLVSLRSALPSDHIAHRHLRRCLEALALACHRQDPLAANKAYELALDRASLAACALLLESDERATEIGLRIEMELIPTIEAP